jgi:hypothetical protein
MTPTQAYPAIPPKNDCERLEHCTNPRSREELAALRYATPTSLSDDTSRPVLFCFSWRWTRDYPEPHFDDVISRI